MYTAAVSVTGMHGFAAGQDPSGISNILEGCVEQFSRVMPVMPWRCVSLHYTYHG